MTISQFRDEVGKVIKAYSNDLVFECTEDIPPDEMCLEIQRLDTEWSYVFAGTSWVAILAGVNAAIANGDFEDPRERYSEYA